jgi:hypothetical protein
MNCEARFGDFLTFETGAPDVDAIAGGRKS